MKNLLLVFCLFLFVTSCSKRKNSNHNVDHSIHFEWHSAKRVGNKYQHAALMIPVRIDTLNNTYKMQLDLGAPINVFYGAVLDNIIQHYPYLKEKITKRDTSRFTWFNGPILMGNSTKIKGGLLFPKKGKSQLRNSKNKKILNGKRGVIGEIGVSQFRHNVLIIDFKNQTIRIRDSLNYKGLANNFSFTKFSLRGRNRIVLKLKMDNKTINAMYDTGQSIIPIATSKREKFNELKSDSSSIDSVKVNGFRKKIKLYKSTLGKNIYLGNTKLNRNGEKVFYVPQFKNLLKRINASYFIGNKFFFNKKIIIDFNKHKFGVSKSGG